MAGVYGGGKAKTGGKYTMSSTFWEARKASVEAQIVAYESAILALADDKIQSYKLDTGQTVQNVTRVDLSRLQAKYDSLLNTYATICARLGQGGTITAQPRW